MSFVLDYVEFYLCIIFQCCVLVWLVDLACIALPMKCPASAFVMILAI